MESLIEEEESRFFDAPEEIVSCSSSSPSSIPRDFQYDVWIKSPGNAEERREKFFNWMGLSSVSQTKSGNVDRFSSSISEAEVLRSLKSDDEFSSCRCDSSVFSPRENNVDRIVKDCKEDVENGEANESNLSTEPLISAEAGSEQRDVGGIMKRVKEKWLSRLSKVRNKQRAGLRDDDTAGEDGVLGSRIERVKVKEYKKESKELSALFRGQEIQAHDGAILAMKFSPDGRYLASAGEDGVLRVWSVVEDERCEEHDVPKMDPSCIYFEVSKLSELRPVAVEKDGISGSLMSPRKTTESACVIIPPKIFRVLDKPLHEFLGHTGEILDISWSKNNRLLSASVDNSVRLWQIGREDCLGIFSHSNYVTSVQFNPVNDDHFISGSIDGKVRIWSASQCQVVDWADARGIVTAVCYRPDGQAVIVGTLTSDCRFYNVSGHCLQLDGHICLHNKKKSSNKRIISFQFDSTDPSRVMVASADSQVRIISGRNVVHKYKGSRNAGNQISASFTADGKHIISACDDSSVYVWNCAGNDPEPSTGFFSYTKRLKIRSFEKFSTDVSVALPWSGFAPVNSGGSELSPSLFSLGREYVLDSPKGSATWPEEKLASSFSPVKAIRRSHYRFLRSSCRRTSESSHLWGLVIVTGGWDGRIRLFHNYGLPVPV
ncbi:COMPASS-like H3K4 histone methylase component WDR5A [Cardamine amara subsp. amara]|uniref:COMPASS-like H3K4 histone methylase component WDR5A n=1 Tax=Cardamine amara subsp. amara TaxID=228776 RepID=A0ABD1BM27_CARAN